MRGGGDRTKGGGDESEGRGAWHKTVVLTFLSLLHLESEVECAYGEVDGLRVGLPHRAQQVQDIVPLLPYQARQQLWYPWQPVVGRDAIIVLVHCL